MRYEFLVEYGASRRAPARWSHIAVEADDSRDGRSIGLQMAARHKTHIISFTRIDTPQED